MILDLIAAGMATVLVLIAAAASLPAIYRDRQENQQ